jgi:hypothetical protein
LLFFPPLDGFELGAIGNSADKLVSVRAQTTQTVEGKNVVINGAYNLLKKCVSGSAELAVDDTIVKLAYDNVDKDAKLSVSQKIDDNNTLKPSISLKSGDMSYGWLRKWTGGSVDTTYLPGDKVNVEWKDNG